jgi:hypothetical protein
VRPLGRLSLLLRALEQHADVDALYHQRLAFQLHFTDCFRDQLPGGCGDLTRLQRASKGPDQSTRRGRHQEVERGGMRLVLSGLCSVVLRDRAVRAEERPGAAIP